MRLLRYMTDGPDSPDTEWTYSPNHHLAGGSEDEYVFSGTWSGTFYVLAHHWFEFKYTRRKRVVVEEHWCRFKREILTRNVRTLKGALSIANEAKDLALKHGSIRWYLRDMMKFGMCEQVYKLEGRVLIPHATVFTKLCGGASSLAWGSSNLVGDTEGRWKSGTYYALHPDGSINHFKLDGWGMGSGTAHIKDEPFPIVRRLFRWTPNGLPEIVGVPYQYGEELVVTEGKEAGVHGRVIGVPLAEDPQGFWSYQLDTVSPQITHKWLCKPEEWAARTLAR